MPHQTDVSGKAASNLPEFEKPARYTDVNGHTYEEKPEHMTALRGTMLVPKTHKLIALRGRVDSLDAAIGCAQMCLQKLGHTKLVSDLGEVAGYAMELLGSEVTGKPPEARLLLGMDENEIRARSHNPNKYYKMNHFASSYTYGEEVVRLNLLRTMVREVELCACAAFALEDEDGAPSRPDIVRGYNRLSSLLYVMMFRARSGEYPLQAE